MHTLRVTSFRETARGACLPLTYSPLTFSPLTTHLLTTHSSTEMTLKAERSFRGLLWGLALFGALLDQSTKYGVFTWLHDSPSESRVITAQGVVQQGEHVIIPGAFKLLAQFDLDKEQGSGGLATLRTL